jgi:hypothetical protein
MSSFSKSDPEHAPTYRIFCPGGDVDLILSNNTEVTQTPTPTVANTTLTAADIDNIASENEGSNNAIETTEDVQANKREPTHIVMVVSSKHMILTSSVFKAMLENQYQEGQTLARQGKVEIPLPDDDPDALIILLYIIHGRTRMIPRRVDLPLLIKLSILVDKYQMHEVVEVFSEIWMEALKNDVPRVLTADTVPWLCISWVFRNDAVFKQVTEQLIRTGDSELDDELVNELPIPQAVIGKCPPHMTNIV